MLSLALLLAQEPAPPGRASDPEFGLSAGAKVRWSTPFGHADGDVTWASGPGGAVVVVDDTVAWSDLFHSGWGAELEIAVLMGRTREFQGGMRYGAYLALEIDHFEGDSVSGDLGGKIRPDDLEMSTIIVGGKGLHTLSETAVAGGRFGIGAVHYSSVDATFSGPLVAGVRDEFIEDTWTFASEFRGHAGVKLGPLALTAGLGLRVLAPPREGDRLDMNSGAFWTFDLDLGAELGF
ncbi:MAG TPA: hypothetical protein VF950_24500 [Planctomycetota bacterium]